MVAPLIKRDDYWQNIKTLGKGVAAGENLASLETADRCAKDVANGHVTRAVQRLTTALSSAPDVIDRGGAWKEVEAAAKAIHLWHGLHSHKSTDSEKRHFRAIVASVSSLLD